MSREPLAFDPSGELIEPERRRPHPRDTDPLTVEDAWTEGYFSGYERAVRDRVGGRPGLLGFVLVAVSGAVVGALFVAAIAGAAHAAPRGAPEHVVPAIAPTLPGAPPVVTDSDVPPGNGAPTPPAARAGTPRPPATPRPAVVGGHARSGVASWYADPRKSGLYAAAGPPLRVGNWRGRTVTVSAGGHSFRVVLSDWCACRDRVIDLSPGAFSRLAALSRGLVTVAVRW